MKVFQVIDFLKQFKEDDDFAVLVKHKPTQNSILEQIDKDAYFEEPTLNSLSDTHNNSTVFIEVEVE